MSDPTYVWKDGALGNEYGVCEQFAGVLCHLQGRWVQATSQPAFAREILRLAERVKSLEKSETKLVAERWEERYQEAEAMLLVERCAANRRTDDLRTETKRLNSRTTTLEHSEASLKTQVTALEEENASLRRHADEWIGRALERKVEIVKLRELNAVQAERIREMETGALGAPDLGGAVVDSAQDAPCG